MSRHLTDLLEEANALIEKRAQATPVKEDTSDEVVKIATLLMDENPSPKAVVQEVIEPTLFEKAAHAVALLETLESLDQLTKLAQFEKQARESGHTEEQIQAYLEKKALKPTHKYVKYLGALGAAGAAAGASHHMGKKKGHDEAVQEINQAFEDYGNM